MAKTPHLELVPLLEKHGITWEAFSKKGRLPPSLCGVVEKRRDIITELHMGGMQWTRMLEVTGLSLGAIERGTRAAWNEASMHNRRTNAAKVAASRKGEKKPWLSDRLRKQWSDGTFYNLLEDPDSPFGKVGGRGTWCEVTGQKCSNKPGSFWVRSTYEKRAVELLEADETVASYQYEPPIILENRRIYPDFVAQSERTCLIEVKPAWILQYPVQNSEQIARLRLSEEYARSRDWDYALWTEKELGL